jgi:hypothetical protein
MARESAATKRRRELKETYWPGDDGLWTGEDEKGWFSAPRTLPLILGLLGEKKVSNGKDPSAVYLELMSRHIDGGIIEMEAESTHAYAAGYSGQRALRTWQERMRVLDQIGFIRTVPVGNDAYRYVALVHPTVAVQRLWDAKKIPDHWWNAYCARKVQTKEATYEQRLAKKSDG